MNLRDQVLDRLTRGVAVAHVCQMTSVPRSTVMKIGQQAGLVYRPGLDAFVRPAVHARPGTLAALIESGQGSRRTRTRRLAGQVRELVRELQHALDAERELERVAAMTEEDNAACRSWAREHGHQVGTRGRIPAAVVVAWTKAGRP